MNIDLFRYFVAVSEERSLHAAAKRLFISPQGLNKSITKLEEKLGRRLLVRTRDGVSLTEAGDRFLVHAREILASYDAMLADMDSGCGFLDDECAVTVYLSYYGTQIMAGSALGRMGSSNVAVVELPFDMLIDKAYTAGENELVLADFHTHSIEKVAKDSRFLYEPYLATVFGVVCKEDSALARFEKLDREQVCHMPMAVNSFREMSQLTNRLFKECPLTNVRLGGTSPRMLLEFVQTTADGVACFDSFGFWLSRHDPDMPTDGLAFVPLATADASCFLGFARLRDAELSERAERFKRSVEEQAAYRFAEYCRAYPVELLWRKTQD